MQVTDKVVLYSDYVCYGIFMMEFAFKVCVCVYLTVDAHTQVFAEMLRGIGIHAYR
jgi:hypothetical protein